MNQYFRAMIPVIGGVVGLIGGVTAFRNFVIKYRIDNVNSEQFTRDVVKQKFRKMIPVGLGVNPSIPNPVLVAQLTRSISPTKLHSLTVIYGPRGVGKSTYLRSFAMKQINDGGHVVVLTSVTSMLELKNLLSIPIHDDISKYVPVNSIIILDQQENVQGSKSTDIMYTTLALEARRTGKFHVFVSISHPALTKRILKLNGGEKINILCPSTDLKVNKHKVDAFITSRLSALIPEEREELRQLAHTSGVLSILVDVANELDGGNSIGSRKMDIIKTRVIDITKSWDEFAAIDENPYK
jgi:energy-coupling factor transporter ATP-binding protein EcfA2